MSDSMPLAIESDPFPEVKVPRAILDPIVAFTSNHYNQWRKANPKGMPYVEACQRLNKLYSEKK